MVESWLNATTACGTAEQRGRNNINEAQRPLERVGPPLVVLVTTSSFSRESHKKDATCWAD